MRQILGFVCIAASLALACGDGGGTDDGGDDGTSTSTDTGDGGPDSDAKCDAYIDCISKVDPDNAGAAEDKYGPGGTCWSEDTPEECIDDCVDFTGELLDDNPNALECGGEPLCPGQCCEKEADCNPDNPCCGDLVCFLDGATACRCLDLPERCNTCMNDCLATMMPPEICEMSCKTWCVPDLDVDPIDCRP